MKIILLATAISFITFTSQAQFLDAHRSYVRAYLDTSDSYMLLKENNAYMTVLVDSFYISGFYFNQNDVCVKIIHIFDSNKALSMIEYLNNASSQMDSIWLINAVNCIATVRMFKDNENTLFEIKKY